MPEAIISAESTEAPTVRSGRFTDRPSLIGVCANPRMTEAVAGEIVRKAGVAAATRLKDNESLPEEFRRGLVAAAG